MSRKVKVWRSPSILLCLVAASLADDATCSNGTCSSEISPHLEENANSTNGPCNSPASSACPTFAPSSNSSVYSRGGGSAQAYKSKAPLKATICDLKEESFSARRHRVAHLPFWRSSYSGQPPVIRIHGRIHKCGGSSPAEIGDSISCPSWAGNQAVTIEAWQARPDGTFSSLRRGVEEGDCRATIAPSSNGSFFVETLAPGSVGALGGLGPNGWDLAPFGPPSVHFLIQYGGHVLLTQVEILAGTGGWSFYGPDVRGPAIVQSGEKSKNYEVSISKFLINEGGDISVEIDFFLQDSAGSDLAASSLKEVLCPYYLHGLPQSFFIEPISVCFPSLLDFFEI